MPTSQVRTLVFCFFGGKFKMCTSGVCVCVWMYACTRCIYIHLAVCMLCVFTVSLTSGPCIARGGPCIRGYLKWWMRHFFSSRWGKQKNSHQLNNCNYFFVFFGFETQEEEKDSAVSLFSFLYIYARQRMTHWTCLPKRWRHWREDKKEK